MENIHQSNNDLPEISWLEELANQYFRALPGDAPNLLFPQQQLLVNAHSKRELIPHPLGYEREHQPAKEIPGSAAGDPIKVPGSLAGKGVSPSALNQSHSFDIREPQTSLPDPHFAGEGRIPQSVAGSGASPSTTKGHDSFNISDPQTSLQDPHFAGNGIIPPSTGGVGKSMGIVGPKEPAGSEGYRSYLEPDSMSTSSRVSDSNLPFNLSNLPYNIGHIPYSSVLPYESELGKILPLLQTYKPSSQIPGTQIVLNESSFYFLNGSHHFHDPRIDKSMEPGPNSKPGALLHGMPFDVNQIRLDFPILKEKVNGHPLIWLDNAATTQKPIQVIDRLRYFYEHENSNIHRAAHELAARATDAYEAARKKVQLFLNAKSPNEIVFVRGATEAINLVAKSWGAQNLREGDEIIISHLEHHANIVPWQQLSLQKGVRLRVIPVDDDGQIILEEYAKLLNPKTKLVSFTQVSNALGTVTPAQKIVQMAHQTGARVLVDGAQTVSHMRADVSQLDCDWYVFSGHKVFGPTGIGVLYGKEDLLNETQPWQGGGNMIKDVTFEHTTYHNAPVRFEAGTGNIADAVGLGAAIDYVNKIGIDLISQYEHYLLVYATKLLKGIPRLRLIGTAADKAGVLSFVLDGYKTEEIGAILNQHGIAVRSGHHCAQPILRRFGVEATVRPSLAFYNTCADIDALINVIQGLNKPRK